MRQFLKYEFKNNWKSFLFSYLITIAAFVILSLFILIEKTNISSSEFAVIVFMNLMLLVGGAMIMGVVLFTINLVRSFYNSIYSDEGYLTLSIPKGTHSLFLSKIISNFVWVIGILISILIGVILLNICGQESINVLFETLYELLDFATGEAYIVPFRVLSVVAIIALSFVLMLLSFTLINMGGVRKAKLVLGLVIYMGLLYALSVLNIFTSYLSFGFAVNFDGEIVFALGRAGSKLFYEFGAVQYVFNATNFIINVGLTIGLYFLTVHLFENRLDME